jgi:hypothetical protein
MVTRQAQDVFAWRDRCRPMIRRRFRKKDRKPHRSAIASGGELQDGEDLSVHFLRQSLGCRNMPNGLTPIATPPKTLEELQQAVSTPKRGYDIHHIVEQTRAEQDGFARSQIDAPENLVRIPTYKHWDINAWFQTKNKQYDDASPREYLRDKGWDERLRVGKQALTDHGVLKP